MRFTTLALAVVAAIAPALAMPSSNRVVADELARRQFERLPNGVTLAFGRSEPEVHRPFDGLHHYPILPRQFRKLPNGLTLSFAREGLESDMSYFNRFGHPILPRQSVQLPNGMRIWEA